MRPVITALAPRRMLTPVGHPAILSVLVTPRLILSPPPGLTAALSPLSRFLTLRVATAAVSVLSLAGLVRLRFRGSLSSLPRSAVIGVVSMLGLLAEAGLVALRSLLASVSLAALVARLSILGLLARRPHSTLLTLVALLSPLALGSARLPFALPLSSVVTEPP